ncbi:hypothetical protein LCGC14_3045220, partial [marine sediment metagenome]
MGLAISNRLRLDFHRFLTKRLVIIVGEAVILVL